MIHKIISLVKAMLKKKKSDGLPYFSLCTKSLENVMLKGYAGDDLCQIQRIISLWAYLISTMTLQKPLREP